MFINNYDSVIYLYVMNTFHACLVSNADMILNIEVERKCHSCYHNIIGMTSSVIFDFVVRVRHPTQKSMEFVYLICERQRALYGIKCVLRIF